MPGADIPPSAQCSHRLSARTLASHAGKRGSIPRGSANRINTLSPGVFFCKNRDPLGSLLFIFTLLSLNSVSPVGLNHLFHFHETGCVTALHLIKF